MRLGLAEPDASDGRYCCGGGATYGGARHKAKAVWLGRLGRSFAEQGLKATAVSRLWQGSLWRARSAELGQQLRRNEHQLTPLATMSLSELPLHVETVG